MQHNFINPEIFDQPAKFNVIFLKGDGVLSPHCLSKITSPPQKNILQKRMNIWALALLNKICKETEALIVLTANWRLSKNVSNIANDFALNFENLNHAYPGTECHIRFFTHPEDLKNSWRTPNFSTQRGKEIDIWFENWGHYVKNYVILDDSISDLLQEQENHIIHIKDNLTGLTTHEASQALDVLKCSSQFSRHLQEHYSHIK